MNGPQPADFFRPDATYQRRRWLFQCLAVAPNPFDAEIRAVGFLFRPGEPATATALNPDDWAHGGWVEDKQIWPTCSQCPRKVRPGHVYCSTICRNLDDPHDDGREADDEQVQP